MTAKLRVLVNAVHAKSGGGVTYLRQLLPLLARRGDLDLHVLIAPAQAPLFEFGADPITVHVHRAPVGFVALLLWEQLAVPMLKRRLSCNVVFSPANYGPLLVRAQLIVLHNALDVGRLETRLAKRFYWWSLALATVASLLAARRAVAVSRYVATTLPWARLLPDPAIIPLGVAPIFRPGCAVREGFLLAIGDLYIQKNYLRLIDAFAIVGASRPQLRLCVVGAPVDADYARKLDDRVRALGLADRISFAGRRPIEEIVALLQRCALFVFPSMIESFGLPLLEAMACGAPVACARAAAMPEIAGDAVDYFDPETIGDMAAVIGRLLDDPARRATLGAAGVERAQNFSWQHCADRTASMLAEATRFRSA